MNLAYRHLALCGIAVVLVWTGCAGSGGNADAGHRPDGKDAGFDDASCALVADEDFFATGLRVGSSTTLELATWNLRNFPAKPETPDLVAGLLLAMDLDLVALQEIADVEAFFKMLAALDGFEAKISADTYSSGEYQKTALVYRRGLLRVLATRSLFTDDAYVFPRPPLEAEFELRTSGGSWIPLLVVNVHLKADRDEDGEARRRDACRRIARYLDERLAMAPDRGVVVLGDFNDELTDPPEDNVFAPLLDDPRGHLFLTRELAREGAYSIISSRSLIDHLLITANLYPRLICHDSLVAPLDRKAAGFDYIQDISDHLPVIARFPW